MSDFPTQLFINGELRPAANGKTIALTNPATGEVFSEAAAATTGDVDGAVADAHAACVQSWRDLSPRQRTDILFAVGQAIRQRAEQLAQLECRKMGRQTSGARDVE